MDKERRRFPRLPFDTKVDYKLVEQGDWAFFTTASRNISQTGICIVTFEQLNSGDILELKFSMPMAQRPITAKGRVVWTDKPQVDDKKTGVFYEAGIEFIAIDDDDRKRIERYVALGVA